MKSLYGVTGFALLVASAALVACGGAGVGQQDGSDVAGDGVGPATAAPAADEGTHPAPVASVEANGKLVEFYEFDAGVLVMETGKAEGSPVFANAPELQDMLESNRLVDLFTTLRPDLAVPSALVDLQGRHPVVPHQAIGSARSTGGGEPATPAMPPSTRPGHRVTSSYCGNGCCDANWLQSNICPTSDDWFYLDYGWSWHYGVNLATWHSVACAALGTSQLTISGSGSGSWSIPQGYYRWYNWSGSRWDASITSTVNSSSSPHDHTHCGYDN